MSVREARTAYMGLPVCAAWRGGSATRGAGLRLRGALRGRSRLWLQRWGRWRGCALRGASWRLRLRSRCRWQLARTGLRRLGRTRSGLVGRAGKLAWSRGSPPSRDGSSGLVRGLPGMVCDRAQAYMRQRSLLSTSMWVVSGRNGCCPQQVGSSALLRSLGRPAVAGAAVALRAEGLRWVWGCCSSGVVAQGVHKRLGLLPGRGSCVRSGTVPTDRRL